MTFYFELQHLSIFFLHAFLSGALFGDVEVVAFEVGDTASQESSRFSLQLARCLICTQYKIEKKQRR